MIKELRESHGWSQDELAKKVGTSYQQIYKLENGERKLSAEWTYKLCKALGCRPDNLIPTYKDLYSPRVRDLLEEIDKLDKQERELLNKIKAARVR